MKVTGAHSMESLVRTLVSACVGAVLGVLIGGVVPLGLLFWADRCQTAVDRQSRLPCYERTCAVMGPGTAGGPKGVANAT